MSRTSYEWLRGSARYHIDIRVNPEMAERFNKAANDLEAAQSLVLRLAAIPETIVGDDNGTHWCPLCDVATFTFDLHADPPVHEETCPWRMAREALGMKWEGWHPDDEQVWP